MNPSEEAKAVDRWLLAGFAMGLVLMVIGLEASQWDSAGSRVAGRFVRGACGIVFLATGFIAARRSVAVSWGCIMVMIGLVMVYTAFVEPPR